MGFFILGYIQHENMFSRVISELHGQNYYYSPSNFVSLLLFNCSYNKWWLTLKSHNSMSENAVKC